MKDILIFNKLTNIKSKKVITNTLDVIGISIIAYILWNWLMSTIFGLTPISLIQSWGLCMLTKALASFPEPDLDHKTPSEQNRGEEYGC